MRVLCQVQNGFEHLPSRVILQVNQQSFRQIQSLLVFKEMVEALEQVFVPPQLDSVRHCEFFLLFVLEE